MMRDMGEETVEKSSYGYGKKMPMWQWIVIYLVVGGVVYGLVYYLVLVKRKGVSYTPAETPVTTAATPTASPAAANSVVKTQVDATKGNYLTDAQGMTLYTFDRDKSGVSNCSGDCAVAWPPYVVRVAGGAAVLPANVTTIKRADGSMQYAWKGKPVYYYANDAKPGDTTGDGVGGLWHVIRS